MPDKNLSRDPARTPMQWNNSTNAGFSAAKPWLRVDKSYRRINVEAQKDDEHSMLTFHRKLIAFRQQQQSLKTGKYIPVHADPQVISFIRHTEGHDKFLIVLNMSHRPCYFTSRHPEIKGEIILATVPELEGQHVSNNIYLSGDEGIIIKLEK
jgi:alpha-glucosidase